MLTNEHDSYANPTIQEAICQINFQIQDGTSWNPAWFGQFFNAVQDEFPNLQPFAMPTGISIQVDPDAPGTSVVSPSPIQVMRYAALRPTILQLSEGTIAINVLAPYLGWEHMRRDISYAWENIIRVINPAAIVRVGLRYINRFERSAPKEILGDWLVATEYIPPAVLKSLHGSSHVQVRLDEHNAIKVVVGGQEVTDKVQGTYGAFIVDMDRVFEGEISLDVNAILDKTAQMHEDVWQVFSQAKGEKLEKLLKGELI